MPPPTTTTTNSVDEHGEDLLTRELGQLSFKDRNDYQDEIHCVKSLAIDETPALIDKSLHELQIEIDYKIPDFGKSAYLQSQLTVKGRSFVNSKEFRVRFLRLELFDIQKSANRMLRWLDSSLGLFGSVVLERPICISTDFTPFELRIFRKGYFQLLPVRATGTGRRILCNIPYDEEWYAESTREAILKIFMYMYWVLGTDIDTQRKGVVIIVMFDSSFHQIQHLKGAGAARPSDIWLMSVRTSAYHICSPDTPFFRLRRSFIAILMGSVLRSRLKLHLGTSIELRYKLQVYGIPIESIPITYTGKIKLSYIRQWLRVRNMIEDQEKLIATNSNTNTNINNDNDNDNDNNNNNNNNNNDNDNDNDNNIVVESPYLGDVLFKRGDSFTSHPGNNTLRNLIECKLKQLHEVENNKPQLKGVIKELKKTLVLEIIDEIEHKHCGRFLYWHQSNNMSECWWLLLRLNGNTDDQKVIFSKIDYLFRQTYSKKQKVIKTKHMKQHELIHQKMDTGQNNSNRNEKRKFECNTSNSTTINQNGGTFLFNSLDGKHRDHASSNGNNDSNRAIAMASSLPSLPSSSECFGMAFVPCSDEKKPRVLS